MFFLFLSTLLSLRSVFGISNVKLALTADQNSTSISREVLQIVKQENCDGIVVNGDLAYEPGHEAWWDMMERELGWDYPIFVAVGDEEDENGDDFLKDFAPRLRTHGHSEFCEGELGINTVCDFHGVTLLLSAHGSRIYDGTTEFIEEALSESNNPWRICFFHAPEDDFQTGARSPHAGYSAYEACRKYGAIVTTANTHTYARSYLMDSFENRWIYDYSGNSSWDPMIIEEGKSFAIPNGCGGAEFHQEDPDHAKQPWWSFTQDDDWKHGVLICTFYDDDMKCEFIDINGVVRDRFFAVSEIGSTTSSASSSSCSDDSFECNNGQCISISYICDGRGDCDDHSDESNCVYDTSDSQTPCSPSSYQCESGDCIWEGHYCDGIVDCDDGSDESFCLGSSLTSPEGGCLGNSFECLDGGCTNLEYVCDGILDCTDLSDELDCDPTSIDEASVTVTSSDASDSVEPEDCQETSFRCGNGLCIISEWFCDGIIDCNDSSDEADCDADISDHASVTVITSDAPDSDSVEPENCQENSFQCGNGLCIILERFCDGIIDCNDSSDEADCDADISDLASGPPPDDTIDAASGETSHETSEQAATQEAAPQEFFCLGNSFQCTDGRCTNQEYVCDGIFDCADHSDEIDCDVGDSTDTECTYQTGKVRGAGIPYGIVDHALISNIDNIEDCCQECRNAGRCIAWSFGENDCELKSSFQSYDENNRNWVFGFSSEK